MTTLPCPSFPSIEPKPAVLPALLSRAQRQRAIERGFRGLYRWYIGHSQAMRNWNPDRSFVWKALRKDLSPNLRTILQGFYAVEQFVPDYTTELTRLTRRSYGRSHFQMRWGMEEEKHADLWRNALLFSGHCTAEWLERYTEELREQAWRLPWDDPLHMLLYTVFQERATQINYLNTAAIARGEHARAPFSDDADPVLAQACAVIAGDEAAHYSFFLEGARMHLYYFPEETLAALSDVLHHFAMPSMDLIPNYGAFVQQLYDAEIYSARHYAVEVVRSALRKLGIANLRQAEAGIRRSRSVPNNAGEMPFTGEGVDFPVVESALRRLFARIGCFEAETGLAEVDPTRFVSHRWGEIASSSTRPSPLPFV